MKTTIDIAEPLLARAKQAAATEGVTVRELVEDGLRHVLDEREQRPVFRLRRATFRGRGLQSNVFIDSQGISTPIMHTPAYDQMQQTILSGLDLVGTGKKTAQQAVDEVTPKVDALLQGKS